MNFYLKSERKIDELEKSKRRRLATLEILETTIEKNKKECDSWISKRNEFQKNDYFLQSQIEMMQNEENLQTQPLIDFLKEKQKQHKKIKDQRSQISTEDKYGSDCTFIFIQIAQYNKWILLIDLWIKITSINTICNWHEFIV